MRVLIFFLAACSAWGQSNIAVTYVTRAGTTNGANVNINSNNAAYGNTFSPNANDSVSEYSLYIGSVGTANVNLLTAEVFQMLGPQIGSSVTYTDASDLVNLANNPLVDGDRVKFVGATSLPAGLSADTVYYVCSATSTTFQIDDDSGCGSVVTDFSSSSGTQTVARWIASSTTFTPSPATSTSWLTFSTFSSHTLVSGRRYAVLMRNIEAIPGTDSIRVDYNAGEAPSMGAYWVNGVNSGLTSTAATRGLASNAFGLYTGYVTLSNGEKHGNPIYSISADPNARIHGTREIGAKFTTPANLKYNVAGVGLQIRGASGSTFPRVVELKLYSVGVGTDTLLGSCDASMIVGNSSTSIRCQLSSTVTLSASSAYRLVGAASGSPAGDSSNFLLLSGFLFRAGETWDNPLSVALTYCAATCTSTANWTDSTTQTAAFALFLDQTTPYASQSSGSAGGAYVVAQ